LEYRLLGGSGFKVPVLTLGTGNFGGTGGGRHYILVALTKHPKGDEYLVDLAKGVDDLLAREHKSP
jgi:aryl-alcohol dehydrogenase-like predicted oxidoreductase